MKINYDLIKRNIATYEEAKRTLPVISQWERGEVNSSVMSSLGLNDFCIFHSFRKELIDKGYDFIMPKMTWFKLKPLLSAHTKTPRLSKFINNRTQPAFKRIFLEEETFDRLLNGRWITKPKQGKRRMTSGRRSDEKVDGIYYAFIPLINYLIQNDVEVNDMIQYQYGKFKWYTNKELTFDHVPKREIDITNSLLDNFVSLIEDSKVDFRKLNIEYITNAINQRLSSLMIIKVGTMIKCVQQFKNNMDRIVLIKEKYYEVKYSHVSNGHLNVSVIDETGRQNYHTYNHFEDMATHRDDLLNSLFGA